MKRRILSVLLVLTLVVGMVPLLPLQVEAAEATSGTCGDNLTWNLDENGTLTISGSGKMKDYSRYANHSENAPWYSQRDSIKNVFISHGVTQIGDYAFYSCSSLASINIPSSVTSIGDSAFYGCTGLTSINIPSSVTSIGDFALCGCSGLSSINIPSSVTSIGDYVFSHCTGLTSVSIPSSASSIGTGTFYGCTGLTSVSIPSSVTSIGYDAFYGCTGLTSINIPSSVTSIGNSALCGCSGLSSINIPSSVTSIGDYVFSYCTGLTSVSIPNSVSSIGHDTFSGCTSLTSISIPSSVTSIGSYAFYGCSSLASISIPSSVTSIEDSAFRNCSSLASINIPSSVTSIGDSAFYGCSSLTSIFFDGDAPSVTEASSRYNRSFPLETTLYYIPGKSGWTSPTWKGYKTATWNGYALSSITPMDFGKIEINYAGKGYAHFMLTDSNGDPLSGARVAYSLSGEPLKTYRNGTLVSDGNGIISLETPSVNSDATFTVTFRPLDSSVQLSGLEQTIPVTVKGLSYKQTWTGELKGSAEFGSSIGVGVDIGEVDFDATLLKKVFGGGKGSILTIEESFENGVRNLELTTEREDLLKYGIKAGVEVTSGDKVTISPIGGSDDITVGGSEAVGLKIKNYDPEKNPVQAIAIGNYCLMLPLLKHPTSIFCNRMLSYLNKDIAIGNQYHALNKAAANGDISALKIKIGDEEAPLVEGALAGLDASFVYAWSKDWDNVDQESVFTKSAIASIDGGLFKSLKIGNKAGTNISGSDYKYGWKESNHKEISAKTDRSSGDLKELSYKTYNGSDHNISWSHDSTDIYSTVTYTGNAAKKIANESEKIKGFVDGKYLNVGIQKAIDIMSSSNQFAQVEETEKVKRGLDTDLSLGISAGASLEFSIGITGENSYSYDRAHDVIYQGTIYPISLSANQTKDEINRQKSKLWDIIKEPTRIAWNACKDTFASAWNSIKDGVKNACATVSGAVSDGVDWVIGLTRGQDNDNKNSVQSYAILSLEDEGTPDSDAALSVTLGDPYLVEVYTDESQETLVTDEQLAASPLTLTLEYTDEMLKAAGATAETDVKIYHYDAERNVYVCLPESTQDREAKSVTAQITQQGEYILAVDTAAPCVSDFKPSDGTAKPTLTALVSDLSGLKNFSFWIDDNQNSPLVTKENLKDYYVEKTGVFTYAMTKDLAVGEHTAYFMAEDTLGNRLTEPVSFTFTVQDFSVLLPAPAVPAETVRDGCFTVKTPAPTDGSVEGMTLVLETEDGRLVSIPMTLENDTWTAEVTDLSGSGTLKVYTIAADAYGNTVESKKQEVKVEEDEEEVTVTSLALGDLLSLDGKAGVKVNVTNGEEGAISALLNVAFYDEKGKQLDVVQTGVGLTGHETQTYTVGSSVSSNQVAKIKAFLLDCADGYTPLCTPVGK